MGEHGRRGQGGQGKDDQYEKMDTVKPGRAAMGYAHLTDPSFLIFTA